MISSIVTLIKITLIVCIPSAASACRNLYQLVNTDTIIANYQFRARGLPNNFMNTCHNVVAIHNNIIIILSLLSGSPLMLSASIYLCVLHFTLCSTEIFCCLFSLCWLLVIRLVKNDITPV